MTGVTTYLVVGLLLPVAAGLALARALFPAVRGARWPEWFGLALLVGPAGASLCMHLFYWDTATGAVAAAALLAAAGALAWRAGAAPGPAPAPGAGPESRILVLAAGAALALAALQFAVLALELAARPTFPWDAWSAWGHKAKAWFHAGHLPEFVAAGVQWARQPEAYAVTAPHYPTGVAGYQVFLAACLGRWHEPLVNLPWLMVHAGLFLLLYGEAVRISGRRAPAVLLASLVASLPLVAAHTALAGYMDLWVALALLALCVCISRAAATPAPRNLAMAALLAVALAGLKVEGLAWVLVVLGVFALYRLSARVTRLPRAVVLSLCAAAGVGVALGAALAGVAFAVPYVGEVGFGFNAGWAEIVASLFVSWNWHLFFPVLALCLVADAVVRADASALNHWRVLAVFGLLTVAVLVLMVRVNEASANVTNYNRIVLQWVPVWAVYGFAVILSGRRGGR